MINVVVIGRYKDAVDTVARLAADAPDLNVIDTAMDEASALKKIDSTFPDMVLMALAGGDTSLIAVAKRIYIYKPKIVTMMFMQEPDDGAYRDALSAGVKYVGKYPETSEALNAKCQEIYDAEQARLQYLSAKNSTVLNGSSVIGVYSPKDGMGSTTISISLASTLARAGQNVALLELDAEFGDIATYLNLTPQKTMADLFSNYETFTVSEVEQCMEVLPSGVKLLAAPKSPEYAEVITTPKVDRLIDVIKNYYDFVILDMPAGMNEKHIELLKKMHALYLVTTLSMSSLTHAKAAVNVIRVISGVQKVKVIVNRYSDKDMLTLQDVHKVLGCPIVSLIPNDYRAAENAANLGVPLAESVKKGDIGTAYNHLARYAIARTSELDISDMNIKQIHKAYDSLTALDTPKPAKKHGGLFGKR